MLNNCSKCLVFLRLYNVQCTMKILHLAISKTNAEVGDFTNSITKYDDRLLSNEALPTNLPEYGSLASDISESNK